VVIRRIAPPDTLGGGRVLDAQPTRHGPSRELTARLSSLSRGERPSDQTTAGVSLPRGSRSAALRERARAALSDTALALEEQLRGAGIEPPADGDLDAEDLAALRDAGRAVRVAKNLHMHADAIATAREQLIAAAQGSDGKITLAEARDALGTSRKFAQALLEHLDSERVFIRRGDAHALRPSVDR
jgi:selenocysteine-specific elongation factor